MLTGQVAVVTGGGRGIGCSIAGALAGAGAAVALLGRNRANLDSAAQDINASGGKAIAIVCDMANPVRVNEALSEVERDLGAISLLVNNAGVADGGLLWQMSAQDWWRIMEVNLRGPLLASHWVLGGMVERGAGCIINIGSYAANSAGPGGSAYSTSKAALQRLTEGIAADVQGSGVTAFCISPGFVWTDMGRAYDAHLRANDPSFEGMDDDWVYPPEAAAELCVRLASGEADTLSGCFIHVRDDLDRMLQASERIAEQDLCVLRLRGLPD